MSVSCTQKQVFGEAAFRLELALMLRNETHDSARCGLVCLLAEKAIGEF